MANGYLRRLVPATELEPRIVLSANMVLDINTFGDHSDPGQFTVVGDNVFFIAKDETNAERLWITDGTPEGTQAVSPFAPDRDSLLVALDEELLYWRKGGTYPNQTAELWKSDGTEEGTKLITDSNSLGEHFVFVSAWSHSPDNVLDGEFFWASNSNSSFWKTRWNGGGGPLAELS